MSHPAKREAESVGKKDYRQSAAFFEEMGLDPEDLKLREKEDRQ